MITCRLSKMSIRVRAYRNFPHGDGNSRAWDIGASEALMQTFYRMALLPIFGERIEIIGNV